MYDVAHVVIVPTTSDFIEGFNKVVAEGVLAGKPVITSSICPALEYVREAVVEVPPNDVDAYAAAIVRLREDANFYQSRREGCKTAQSQFYDVSRGWGAGLGRMLKFIGAVAPDRENPESSSSTETPGRKLETSLAEAE